MRDGKSHISPGVVLAANEPCYVVFDGGRKGAYARVYYPEVGEAFKAYRLPHAVRKLSFCC